MRRGRCRWSRSVRACTCDWGKWPETHFRLAKWSLGRSFFLMRRQKRLALSGASPEGGRQEERLRADARQGGWGWRGGRKVRLTFARGGADKDCNALLLQVKLCGRGVRWRGGGG